MRQTRTLPGIRLILGPEIKYAKFGHFRTTLSPFKKQISSISLIREKSDLDEMHK